LESSPEAYPPRQQHHEATVESLVWYSDKVYISLVSQEQYSKGHFFIATYSYMRCRGGGEKMRAIAERKLTCTRDEYTPTDGWTQEPDQFSGLKLDMTTQEAASILALNNCTPKPHPSDEEGTEVTSFLYDTTLNVGGLVMSGEVFFDKGRLINIGGSFDRSRWDAVKSTFTDLYGRPHCDERREILDSGLHQTVDWTGDHVWVRLLNYPNPENVAKVCFQRSLKGMAALCGTSEVKLELKFVSVKAIPPPEPPKIVVEHAPSMLTLHLPDGARLDYQRDPPLPSSLKSTWHRDDDGQFLYDLDIDVRTLSRIGLGDGRACGGRNAVASQPEGWDWLSNGWAADLSANKGSHVSSSSNTSMFSITSAMLPGPVPIYLVRKDAEQRRSDPFGGSQWDIPMTLPRRLYDAVRNTLQQQTAFLSNSFVIGPATAPNLTEYEFRQLVQVWIDSYGFDFLAPAVSGDGPLLAKLDQL
jgi:hypothetical protein